MKLELRKHLLRLVHDVAEEVADAFAPYLADARLEDPIGALTIDEAAELMEDYHHVTVAQAERLFALSSLIPGAAPKPQKSSADSFTDAELEAILAAGLDPTKVDKVVRVPSSHAARAKQGDGGYI